MGGTAKARNTEIPAITIARNNKIAVPRPGDQFRIRQRWIHSIHGRKITEKMMLTKINRIAGRTT
jgi:hypothetical protein